MTARAVALVTGAGDGIGWAIASRLAHDGLEVILVDRDDDALVRRVDELQRAGCVGVPCRVDLACRDEVLALEQRLGEPLTRLKVLVNNAGLSPKRGNDRIAFADTRFDSEWRQTVEINLTAAFLLCRMAVGPMRRLGRGRIINMSSRVGRSPTGSSALASMPYLVTKTALLGLTRALAQELAADGITVNSLAPGRIATRMGQNIPAEAYELIRRDIPVGRWGEPEDIAHAAAYLVSDAAGFITGATLDVNGGALML